jgi:hypothetical protein
MPNLTPDKLQKKMDDEQDGSTKWEFVVGRALKDWASALMQFGMTRAEARVIVLAEIKEMTERVNADFAEKKGGSNETGISN